MKVLLLSVTIGAGHNIVANNLKTVFEQNGHHAEILKLFENNKPIHNMISGYGFTAMNLFPKIANYYYFKAQKQNKCLYDNLIKKIHSETLSYINSYKPDVIISTHVAGLLFVQKYRSEIHKKFASYFICTDYDITPSLRNDNDQDFIVVPTQDMKDLLVDRFAERNLLTFGIPISEKFYQNKNKNQIIQKHNLQDFNLRKKTVLFMGGAKGHGKLLNAVKSVVKSPEIQAIVICGKNQKLLNKVKQLNKKNIFVFSYIDFVDELMQISDYIYGKVGGLSATEALAKDLTIISTVNIPCPEYTNLLYLEKFGCAVAIKNPKQLINAVKNKNIKKDKSFYIPNSSQSVYLHIVETKKERP